MNICGMGLITAAGLNCKDNWDNISKAKSFINEIDNINISDLSTKNGGQIKYSDNDLINILNKKIKLKSNKILPLERAEILLFISFIEALEDSNFKIEELQNKRVGILAGTSLSGFTNLESDFTACLNKNSKIHMDSYLTYPLNTSIDRLAYEFNIHGPRFLFSTACSASLHPFVVCEQLFENNEIDYAIVCGSDPLSLMSLAGFNSLKSLAPEKCTPFSTGNYGISIGEGAGTLIISNKIESNYGFITGVSGTSDAYHPTASNPTGETIKACVVNVCKDINFTDKDVLIMTHGTGTPHNDTVEMRALKQIPEFANASIMATKSVFGHTLGASGAIETILLAKCLKEKHVLPIANFSEYRNQDSLKCVTEYKSIEKGQLLGIKSSFAFGGNNVSVALENQYIERNKIKRKEDIVVTGIGYITGFEEDEKLTEYIISGETAIRKIKAVKGFNSNRISEYADIIDDEKLEQLCLELRLKNTRKMDKISKIACVAGVKAVKNSNLKITNLNSSKIAVITATGTGPLGSVEKFYSNIIKNGSKSADANVFPNTVVNAHLGYLTIELKIKGYSTVIAQGESGPYAALRVAMGLLESNNYDAVLVGGVSEYSEAYHKALIDIGSVGNDSFQKLFGNKNNKNCLGEAGAFFVLERKEDALKRNADIKIHIKNVLMNSTNCFPSTYRMKDNPLTKLFEYIQEKGIKPDYIATEGNALIQENKYELEAIEKIYKGIDVTSASIYFGFISSVIPFLNMILFYLCHKKNVVIDTVAPGGLAGLIYLEKN